MEAFLFFLLGFACSQWIFTFFESISKLICTMIEAVIGYFAIIVNNQNNQIRQTQISQEHTQVIGFSIPTEEEEEQDD